jgi:hypothetical protein
MKGALEYRVNVSGVCHFMDMLLLLLFWWWGPISTAAMRAYCTLTPPMEFRHSSAEALHTKRRERPLASEGRN